MIKADIILSSNVVFTGLEDKPQPAAIAVKGNKIIAAGSKDEIKDFIGDETKVYNFNDKLIMAGFHDAHLHLLQGSLFKDFCVDLSEARSGEQAAGMVKQFADDRPDEEWVIGTGWDSNNWINKDFPDRSILDQVICDRPVLLIHAECHYAWVNTKALEIANINSETKNPPYGTILKDEDGNPTGILIETAISLAGDIAFNLSKKRQYELLEGFLQYSSSLGVTSVNDLYGSRANEKLTNYDLFKEFDDEDRLTARVHIYPAMNGDIDRVKQLRENYNSEKFRVAGLKQFIDGVVTGHTAYMLDPYLDKPETKGQTAFQPETIKKWVIEADKEGFQIRFHAIGDGAVRLGLDVFEESQKVNGERDSRHCLEHVEVIHPDDIPRFKELGVIASIQPSHIALMPRESHTLRTEKEKHPYLYTCNALKSAGAQIAFGSDFPVASLNPMVGIYHAVTRADYNNEAWNKQEQVSLADALKAYTLGAAYSVFRENELGTLEEGKLADIVVLDRNIFVTPVEELLETKVEMTIMDGRIVAGHQEPETAGSIQ
ncbi:amidohydrolase [Scopulibacillus cellulosilyticus]|uniref:Amidohydrolase n=1 Tax=Scopulibacillus cellulosilyticus TaxID=2665665 RepID=A0ABW2Q1Y0_9BACL